MVEQSLPEVTSGLAVGLSVSQSEDLGRYGLTETHVRMALGEIARAVLVADGHLVYGGHLEEDGYTTFLVREIERFGRRNRPFTGYVPFPVHRSMAVDLIEDRIEDLSVLGTYVFLDVDGSTMDPVDGRSSEPQTVDESLERAALTAAREVMAQVIDGRVALGGSATATEAGCLEWSRRRSSRSAIGSLCTSPEASAASLLTWPSRSVSIATTG